jgi:DNA gyrase subunit A
MAPLAMEMVRDIDEDTVDFRPTTTARPRSRPCCRPLPEPARQRLSSGIAVGMATNIPPHNLREVAAAAQWVLAHPDASREETCSPR